MFRRRQAGIAGRMSKVIVVMVLTSFCSGVSGYVNQFAQVRTESLTNTRVQCSVHTRHTLVMPMPMRGLVKRAVRLHRTTFSPTMSATTSAAGGAAGMAGMMFRKTFGMVMDEPLQFTDVLAQDKGKLKVRTSEGDKEIDFMWAGFGGPRASLANVAAVAAVLCDPERADQELSNAAQLQGKVAVVKRGGNSFVEKALRAEKAGALCVVIINSDNTLIKAGGDASANTVTIPVLLVAAEDEAALLQGGSLLSLESGVAAEGSAATATSQVMRLITSSVPLFPLEELELSVPKKLWAQALTLAMPAVPAARAGEDAGEVAGEVAGEDAGERRVLARPLPVCVFYGEGDGEVATVGTVAEIREVLGAVADDEDEAGGEADRTARRRSGADMLRVRIVATATRVVFSGVDSATSDSGPGTVRCTPMPPPSFSYGGTGLKDLLLKVAQQVPDGVAAEGGWATAYQEVKASLAECAEVAAGESAGGGSAETERVGWVAGALLPWTPRQRQHLLQCNSPDMRAMAVTHVLNRLSDRYDQTRHFLTSEHQVAEVCSASRPDARRGVAAVAQKVLPATVKILPTLLRDSKSKGSGFVVSHTQAENGALEALIITNAHVAGLTVGIDVICYDGRELKGTLVGRDLELDIALVKITLPPHSLPLPEMQFADSDCVLPGDFTLAVGHPADLDNIITHGVVSGLIRPLAGGSVSSAFVLQRAGATFAKRSRHKVLDRSASYVVTDAKVAPGMSGGPLVDAYGRLVGVNTFLRPDVANMAFAIASNRVREAIDDILLRGEGASEMTVWLVNDNMNTRARVSAVLQKVAGLSAERADVVMMEAHTKGASSIATLPKSEAEALVERMLRNDLLAECRTAVASRARE